MDINCVNFSEFSKKLFESPNLGRDWQIEIKKADETDVYYPVIVSISWIARVLRFFGWKTQSRRLDHVSSSLITWFNSQIKEDASNIEDVKKIFQKLKPLINRREKTEASATLQRRIKKLSEGLSFPEAMEKELVTATGCHLPRELKNENLVALFTSFISFYKALQVLGSYNCINSTTYRVYSNERAQTVQFPFKVVIENTNNTVEGIIPYVNFKGLVGEGGQRKVWETFNSKTGEGFVRKRIVTAFENGILGYLKDHPSKGLEHPLLLKESKNKSKWPTCYEHRYEATLKDVGNRRTLTIEQKEDICAQLIMGIHNLRGISLKADIGFEVGVGASSQTKLIQKSDMSQKTVSTFIPLDNLMASNEDLKPANILFREVEGNLSVAINDFGLMGYQWVAADYGSPFFRPPEAVSLIQRNWIPDVKKCIEHNKKYAPAKDLWGLGLLLAFMLWGESSRITGVGFPAIPCLENRFLEKCNLPSSSDVCDIGIINVTQEELSSDLEALKKATDPQLHSICDLIKELLICDPDSRMEQGGGALNVFYNNLFINSSENLLREKLQNDNTYFTIYNLAKTLFLKSPAERRPYLDKIGGLYSAIESSKITEILEDMKQKLAIEWFSVLDLMKEILSVRNSSSPF